MKKIPLFLSMLAVIAFSIYALAGGLNEATPPASVPTIPYQQPRVIGLSCVPAIGQAHMGICSQHSFGTTFSPTTPYGRKGIDISNYQGYPNFGYAKSHGLAFVLNQSGDGSNFFDSNFSVNWARERALGIPHGAYIFVRPGCPFCQANAIYGAIKRAGGQDSKAFPPVLDAEVSGAYQEVCPIANDLRVKLHIQVIVYTSPGLWPGLGSCGTLSWPAEWGSNGYAFSPWSSFVAQQYSATGYVPGVEGQVDLDNDHGLLALLIHPKPKPEPTKEQQHKELRYLLKTILILQTDLTVRRCRVAPYHGRGKYHRICAYWIREGKADHVKVNQLHREGVQ